MNRSEIAVLRTQLRELNIEYSALVRGKMGEGSFVRMEQLRAERRALMALVAQHRREDVEHHSAVCSLAGAKSLAALEAHTASSAGAGIGAGDCSVEVSSACGGDVDALR